MPVLLIVIKVSVLLSVALVVARLMRRAPASSLHRLWSGAFLAVLVLPLLAMALPEITVTLPAWTAQGSRGPSALAGPASQAAVALAPAGSSRVVEPPAGQVSTREPAAGVRESRPRALPSARAVLLSAWLAGAAAAMTLLALSFWRVRRMARGAVALDNPEWAAAVGITAARLGMRTTPRVLISSHATTPMAGGLVRPTVFVPAGAPDWSAERRDIVLAHEIAHLAGRDPLRQIVARLALAIYWFHPLAWLAAREAAAAREQACDEAVIALGTRPSTYARVLLDFADAMPAAAPALAALPMIERTLLEKRLMAILNDDARPRARRLVMVPVIGVAVFTVSVAAVQLTPASGTVGVSGRVEQAVSGGVPAGVAGGVQGVAGGTVAAGAAHGVPAGVRGGVTGGVASGVGGGVAGGVPAQEAPGDQIDPRLAMSETACINPTSGSFHGSISSSDRGGVTGYISEVVGQRGNTFLMQKVFGDLRVCLLAVEAGKEWDRPSTWAGRARRLVLESQRGGSIDRMEIEGRNTRWTVDGRERPVDAAAAAWRDRMMAVLDTTWEISSLQGQQSSLRGEISSIHGQRSSLQGQISSLQGEISSMHGTISSIQGQESSLRGQISSIQGHVSSLRGAISSEQGAISSLSSSRFGISDAERARIAARIREHEQAITRLEAEIRAYDAARRIADVEREIASLKVEDKIEEIRKRIRAFDLDAKVDAIRRRIAELNVEGRVTEIERRIRALNVDSRVRELEGRRDSELRALESAMAAIR